MSKFKFQSSQSGVWRTSKSVFVLPVPVFLAFILTSFCFGSDLWANWAPAKIKFKLGIVIFWQIRPHFGEKMLKRHMFFCPRLEDWKHNRMKT